MPGWSWLVIAALLFSAEMFLLDAQFYLVFFGAAAAVVGLLVWFGVPLSDAMQWLLFAVLSIIAMVGFRRRLYERLRQPVDALPETTAVGGRLALPQDLQPGQQCRVEYRGSNWSVRNVDQQVLHGEVMITGVDGLTLLVRKLD